MTCAFAPAERLCTNVESPIVRGREKAKHRRSVRYAVEEAHNEKTKSRERKEVRTCKLYLHGYFT